MRFHEAGGSGYRFVADQIIKLDPLNPQVAARLAGAFTHWRRYDGDRSGSMQTQLERMLRKSKLSTDVREIVSKSLN